MTEDETREYIKLLARRAAYGNLKLRHAMTMFSQIFVAEAVAAEQGNLMHAAEALQIERASLARIVRRGEARDD